MAEQEKVDSTQTDTSLSVGKETKKPKAAAKRRPARGVASRKIREDKYAKKVDEDRSAFAKKEVEKPVKEGVGISTETLLSVFLAISLLLNVYLFFQTGSLRGEVESLKLVVAAGERGTTGTTLPAATTPKYSGEKVKLDFYVMSQCPYGIQVVNAIAPVVKQLGGALDLSINYIGGDDGSGNFNSLHGQNEVLGDIVQLCAMKYEPVKYIDMFTCMNEKSTGIPANWESCAQKYSMDSQAIKSCYEGAEGKQLLSASFKKASDVQASGSPTIYLKGKRYSGGRTTNDFLRAVCAEFSAKPDACKNLPESVKVNVLILNDKRCGQDCDMISIVSQLKSIFPGMSLKELDYGTPEGKALFERLNITVLPVVLFDSTVSKGEGYSNVQRYLEQVGEYQSLRIGSNWDPYCDATQEHCSDSKCKERVSCRPETPKKLDVFVMSQCPYGIQALNAMKAVLEAFKGQMDFSVNFIATETSPGVFQSLHGQGEVDENLREICAAKYYKDNYKYMDYILCRNKAITNTAWESCATSNGMDAAKIKACAEGSEGKQLLSQNVKIAEQLAIGGSPTFLVNNKKTFNAINEAGIQAGFCGSNPGLAGCSKLFNTTTPVTPTSGTGGSCG